MVQNEILQGLLAIIHRDGGHHTEYRGLELSVQDAQQKIVTLYQTIDQLLPALRDRFDGTVYEALINDLQNLTGNKNDRTTLGTSNNTIALVNYLIQEPENPSNKKISDRKLRLFACACARQMWKFIEHEEIRNAIIVAE